ncbi:MAG: Gfo/Idh/MocA family oxidoreductase [Bryobacteraceae bacterium]
MASSNSPHRRNFLIGSAAALAVSGSLAGRERELRTALIGVGNRGTAHVNRVLQQTDVRVAAICDTDPNARDRAQGLAKRDSPRSYTDYREVLDLKDVDAVVIATPCDLHAPMAVAALEAGKHVYCEKPLGVTPEQVSTVLRAAAKAKTLLQVGQQLRYIPALREMVRLIQTEGVAGTPFVIKAQRHATPPAPGTDRVRPSWYLDAKRSGDLIVENAVHNLDICNWVAASRPVSAYGHGKRYLPQPVPAGSLMMDGFSVEYIYENDMHLDYSQLYLHARGLKELANGQFYIVFGDKGSVNLTKGLLYEMQGGEPKELLTQAVKDAKENAMEDFHSCIRENRQPFADVKVGATAALTAILGREAIYRRKSVDWSELGVTI